MGSASAYEALPRQRSGASTLFPTAAFGPLSYVRAAEGMIWNVRRSRYHYNTHLHVDVPLGTARAGGGL
jgi:hypothetical protein